MTKKNLLILLLLFSTIIVLVSPSQALAQDRQYTVIVTSTRPLDFHVRRDGRFLRLCTTPCELHLAEGNYRLGVSPLGEDAVPSSGLRLRHDMALRLRYTSAARQRVISFVVLGIAVTATAILAPLAIMCHTKCRGWYVGLSLSGLVTIISLFSALSKRAVSYVQMYARL